MQIVAVQAKKRDAFGKKASREIRKGGNVPAIVYAKDGVEHIVVSPKTLKHLIYTPDFKLAEIDIDGNKHKAIIKDIQFHPVTEDIQHIDFLRLIEDVNINFDVPIVFKGESPGVKAGGQLVNTLRKVTLKSTPDKIIDHVEGDISELELGSSLKVKDLEIPEGIEVMNFPNTPVGIVEIPRAAKTAEEEEAELLALEEEEVAAAAAAAGEEGQETTQETE